MPMWEMLIQLMDQKSQKDVETLKPIERYAVNFLEVEYKSDFDEKVREAQVWLLE
ncbi:hypothetical protein KIN20_029489 [Parelaphostrongylus tenuis]|uniref:Uncharacterized protein n=1 Tax=Parelaphostrongylus tenuis TaxID=148309 RepID=A0AAD5R2G2_PARTN|nr:hypothetical protein KIN20_029489 [Parelaphostrongylus tenuis]